MSLKPVIKGYHSSDVENLWNWSPPSLESVYFPLEVSIGLEDDNRSDIFQILVATPEAIRSRMLKGEKCAPGRHILLVAEYDWPSITKYCTGIVASCTGDTWEDVTSSLTRFFRWEFENYK